MRIKGLNIKKHNLSFVCYDLRHISNFTKQLENSTYKLMKKALPGHILLSLMQIVAFQNYLKTKNEKWVSEFLTIIFQEK